MNRRDALRSLGLAAALYGIPRSALADDDESAAPLRPAAAGSDGRWDRPRRAQSLMRYGRAVLNTGSLGVAPRPVVRAVADYLDRAAALHIDDGYPRWGYETLDAERTALAAFVGCDKDELAIVHNATEAMSIIAGGMVLPSGSEVLLTNQEHPSGTGPWQVRAARGELEVRVVDIPLPPESPEQLVDIVTGAIGPRTRVLSFSGITSPTGLLMPIREICDIAREKGVITVVDGAHMTGQVPYRIDDMGCDYFAGSPHKWLFAPAGSGLLFIRRERLDEHYPVIATAKWDDLSLKAGRFMRFGTNNRAIIEGFMAGLQFAQDIGPVKIYERIHALAMDTYARARTLPYVEMLTPEDDRMYGSLVTFGIDLPERKLERLWALCRERRIWTTENPRLRISTHVHTRRADLDLFFETLAEAAA